MKKISRKLVAKEISLISCFTAVYAVLALIPIFRLIGPLGGKITVSAIIAPIIGIILGPYLGTISTFLGGLVGFSFNPDFSLPSLISGAAAASCAGLLCVGKRWLSVLAYLMFLLSFSFYVPIGPTWVYPLVMWFQIVGFLVLVSPLQSLAVKNLTSNRPSKALFSFFAVALTSTLAGQIAGTLVFEMVYYPALIPDVTAWKDTWQALTFLYPVERTIIAISAAFFGSALHRALKFANLIPLSARKNLEGKYP